MGLWEGHDTYVVSLGGKELNSTILLTTQILVYECCSVLDRLKGKIN